MACEAGFGSAGWPTGEAEGQAETRGREPWLDEPPHHSTGARGGGWHAEVSCRVDGAEIRAETTAAVDVVAVLAAAWLSCARVRREVVSFERVRQGPRKPRRTHGRHCSARPC